MSANLHTNSIPVCPDTFLMRSKTSTGIQKDSLFKNCGLGAKKGGKKVNFMTLLPYREPNSGRHHGDLRAHSGQWAAPFKMLSEADGGRVQESTVSLQGGRESSALLVWCVCLGLGRRYLRCVFDGWWCPLAIFPVFGSKNLVPCWEFFFWLMFICSVGLKGCRGKVK